MRTTAGRRDPPPRIEASTSGSAALSLKHGLKPHDRGSRTQGALSRCTTPEAELAWPWTSGATSRRTMTHQKRRPCSLKGRI
eukprot:CAMPEP_0182537100 /NCGR_PEP_ID=MMETSP1323-20130603/21343_1 /TAXON_ID=236787 /ORGANISM="Florenciella parvula, Strain RCC1693" /LENGTH=81 /DNA_ID=CAMNT_0024747431 /DNA_START=101 /DNA_END=346 /DNA_ORIENTATION=-